jgi:hypothetical protein
MKSFWRILLVMLVAMAASGFAFAQIDPEEPLEEDPDEMEEPIDVQSATPDVAKINADSLDSLDLNVPSRVLVIEWDALMRDLPYAKEVRFNLASQVYSDVLDRLPGFSQTLGQIGKPYRRYLYGFHSAWQEPDGIYLNPITREEEAYLTHPEQGLQLLDSRTPYVNVQYTQGRRKYTVLDVTISRNISPFINAAAFYRKRLCLGPYENANTDHLNLGYSMRARSRDNRYHASLGLVFDELKDFVNGGIYQDEFDSLFFAKGGDLTTLDEAKLNRRHRAAQVRQLFRFQRDSVASRHHFVVFHSFLVDELSNHYGDAFSASDATTNQIYPIYPTIAGLRSNEFWRANRWNSSQGLSYHFGGDTLGLRLLGAADYGVLAIRDKLSEYDGPYYQQYTFTPKAEAAVNFITAIGEGVATAEVRQTRTSLYAQPENKMKASLSMGLLGTVMDHLDTIPSDVWYTRDSVVKATLHRPLQLDVSYVSYERNPSFLNTFYTADTGNAFTSIPSLDNERYTHLRGGLTVRGREVRKGDQLLPFSYFGVTVFATSIDQMIWYGDSMEVNQSPLGQVLNRSGFEQKARLRLGPFTLENRLTVVGTSNADTTTLVWQQNHLALPRSYGFFGVFYEQHNVKVANAVRAGVEFHFQSAYHGKLFDPATQQFYSQGTYEMPSNTRIDVYAALHIKKAFVFIRVLNAFEGVGGKLGYFTTPFYPMPERAFQFGVNWSFYD